MVQVKYEDHVAGKSHAAKEKAIKSKALEQSSSSQTSAEAKVSTSEATLLETTSDLKAAIGEAELYCNFCQVQSTSQVKKIVKNFKSHEVIDR